MIAFAPPPSFPPHFLRPPPNDSSSTTLPSFLPPSRPSVTIVQVCVETHTRQFTPSIPRRILSLSLSLELSISVLYLLLFFTDSLWKFKVYCRLLRREKGMNACLYEIVIIYRRMKTKLRSFSSLRIDLEKSILYKIRIFLLGRSTRHKTSATN